MRKLVEQASIPKDATSSREGMNLTYQKKIPSSTTTDRGSMPLIKQPSIKPGNASNSVESVAPNGKG
jgi:hypothetical protein